MKKLFALLLAAIMVLSLAACGSKAEEAPAEVEAPAAEEVEEDVITVGFALNDLDEAQSTIWAVFEEACIDMGMKPVLANAAGSIDQQLDIGLFLCQQSGKFPVAVLLAKVQNDGADRHADFGLQTLQGICPPGDDPDLVHLHVAGQLQDEFFSHTGAGSGHNRDFHM